MWKSNNLMVKGLSYGVTINLYVLLVFLVDKIDSNLDGISVVSIQGCRLNLKKTSSIKKPRSQMILEQAINTAWYLVSIYDLETKPRFWHFQEICASPRNIHKPVVDFLVSSNQPNQHHYRHGVGVKNQYGKISHDQVCQGDVE